MPQDAGVAREDIDEVLLVGGSTRPPKIQEYGMDRGCHKINFQTKVIFGSFMCL